MSYFQHIILLIGLSQLSFLSFSQQTYFSTIDGFKGSDNGKSYRHYTCPNELGGYFSLMTYEKSSSEKSLVISKVDICDNVVWTREFYNNDLKALVGYDLISESDNAYVLVNLIGAGIDKNLTIIIKLSQSGIIEKSIIIEDDNLLLGEQIEFFDENILLVGTTGGRSDRDYFVLKINKDLDIIRSKRFDFPNISPAESSSITHSKDGDIFFAASSGQIIFDQNLNVKKTFNLIDWKSTTFHSVNLNGSFLVPARTSIMDTTQTIYKIGSEGNIEGQSPRIEIEDLNAVISFENSLVFIGTNTINKQPPAKQALTLVKTDFDLQIKSMVEYDRFNGQISLESSSKLDDGSLLISGHEFFAGWKLPFVIRLNPEMQLEKCPEINSFSSSISTSISIDNMEINEIDETFISSVVSFESRNIELNRSIFCDSSYVLDDILTDFDSVICFGDSIELFPLYNFSSFQWINHDNDNEALLVKEKGWYSLIVNGPGCSESIDSIYVDFANEPDLDYGVSSAVQENMIPIELYERSDMNMELYWVIENDTLQGELIEWIFEKNGMNKVFHVAIDEYGCQYIDSLDVTSRNFKYYIPNSFSPNQDGLNDCFSPTIFGYESYELSVFNRWGDIIFKGKNQMWCPGKLPSGQYTYAIEVTDKLNERLLLRGSINVTP